MNQYWIDAPSLNSKLFFGKRTIRFSGWFFDKNGKSADRLFVKSNGQEIACAKTSRADVVAAFPGKIIQADCGFHLDLKLNFIGAYNLMLWAITKGGESVPLKRVRVVNLGAKTVKPAEALDYQKWISLYDKTSKSERIAHKTEGDAFAKRPKISVVMPVYNAPEKYLKKAIESVINQTYENWELCIADDASTQPHIKTILEKYKKKDARIKVVYRSQNGHISEASNSAIEIASSDYMALLDNDDELHPFALHYVVKAINERPDAKLIYSDEDKMNEEGERFDPYFKTDFNYQLFLRQNCICHLGVYEMNLTKSLGGFRKGYEGAQDWDFALRFMEKISRKEIVHIRKVLYHWRTLPTSTASGESAKGYAKSAGIQSVEDHLHRINIAATVTPHKGAPYFNDIYYKLAEFPEVNIIMPMRDKFEVTKKCVDSILELTKYPNYKITIIDNGSIEAATLNYIREVKQNPRITVIRDDGPFNYSRINNNAIGMTNSPLICLMNNDMEVISPEWLSSMVGNLSQCNVGAVGARLLYPCNLVQHAGVTIGIGGVAGHIGCQIASSAAGYFGAALLTRNSTAVTAACLLTFRSIYDKVNGLDEANLKIAFNDVDLCLKIINLGYEIIYDANAELYHHESLSRGLEDNPEKMRRFQEEAEYMMEKWNTKNYDDPYYNPNLSLDSVDYKLASPPRKEWISR